MNLKRIVTPKIIIGVIIFVVLIVFLLASKQKQGPSITVNSSEPSYNLQLNEDTYPMASGTKKFTLKDPAVKYRAVNKDGISVSGVIDNTGDKQNTIDINFEKYKLKTIYSEICNGSAAVFCTKDINSLKYNLINNNSWALITSDGNYQEAVTLSDENKWIFAQITQSDINSGQLPKGLEGAAREYE